MRDYGIDRKNFRTSTGEINPNCDISLEGYGATLSEINSYIGLKQMDNLPHLLEKQRRNAIDWNNRIQEISSIKALNLISDTQPNYWVFGVLCEDKAQALQDFRNQNWYATGVHINNNIYSVFNNLENLNGVNEFMNKFLALPCGWWVNYN